MKIKIGSKEVYQFAKIRKPDMLRRLLDQLAPRTAEEINVATLCQMLGAHKETVNDYRG